MRRNRAVLIAIILLSAVFLSCGNSIVPKDFDIPQRLETEDFIIRPLRASDAKDDYEAVMESVEIIHRALLSDKWPGGDFTVQMNREQIMIKEKLFKKRKSFTYAVLSLDEKNVLGSIYINKGIGGPDAAVFMWVRKSAYDRGLDPVLEKAVRQWISEKWPFEYAVFPGRSRPD